jgi:hypothetical protein
MKRNISSINLNDIEFNGLRDRERETDRQRVATTHDFYYKLSRNTL